MTVADTRLDEGLPNEADRLPGTEFPPEAALQELDTPPPSDRRPRVIVWATWVAMVVSSFVMVLRGARNIPIQEDWHLVPAMTGHQDHFWQWVFRPNNEHRVAVPKLVYLGLLKLWPDFRVGMIFNMLLLAAVSGGFILVIRHVRGRTRWTDAFFPVVFLHLGHWENLGWSWQLQFVVATALACAVLIILVLPRPWTTSRAVMVGLCLVMIPFTGATALPFAPFVAVGLIADARSAPARPKRVLLGAAVSTIALSVAYFIGLPKPAWVPPSPSRWASIQTALKFLSLGLGPAAGGWWLASVVGVVAVLAAAGYVLVRAWRRGTATLLAFLAAGVVLAGSLGNGRAGTVPYYGLPDRYALIAVPALCCAYLAFELHGGPGLRKWGPGVLCAALVALLPLNIDFGLQYRDWYHHRVDTFAADVKAGVPLPQLNYDRQIAADPHEMWLSMTYLHQAKLSIFGPLQETDHPLPPLRNIDGLPTAVSQWVTVGGPASTAVLGNTNGASALDWRFDVAAGRDAAIGRQFPTPQNWQGDGAMVLTFTGQGSGRRIHIRISFLLPNGKYDWYDSLFADSVAGSSTVVIPWNGFGHVVQTGTYDLQGPMPQQGVVAVTFITSDPGPGRVLIQQVALQPGHGQMGWPFHSAADRRSLPPWR